MKHQCAGSNNKAANAYLGRAAIGALRVPDALTLTVKGMAVSLEGNAFTIDNEQGSIPLGGSERDISRHVDCRSGGQTAEVEWLSSRNNLKQRLTSTSCPVGFRRDSRKN
mgnify:CR=1 FL=1